MRNKMSLIALATILSFNFFKPEEKILYFYFIYSHIYSMVNKK